MESDARGGSAAQQLEEMRARQAVVPQLQLSPSPPAATEPAASAPVPVASVAPPETTTTTTTTTVETIDAPTAAAITPAHAMTSPVYAVPVEQRHETVGLTINVAPPAEGRRRAPDHLGHAGGPAGPARRPGAPRAADLAGNAPAHLRVSDRGPARRVLGGTAPGCRAPAPAAAAVFHPSSPAAPAPAPVASAPMATQSDLPRRTSWRRRTTPRRSPRWTACAASATSSARACAR